MKTDNSCSSWRIAPAILLFFLAPLFGEYLLGNLKFTELLLVPFIAPLYGGGALLVREVSRRAGRGYGTMLLLGVAYALIEEALVDQLIFNPAYFAGQQDLMHTVIPSLGIDVWLTLIVIAMHAVWSICIPIILVEAIFDKGQHEPWLGNTGLALVTVIFTAGSLWLWKTISLDTGFSASAPQLISSMAIIAVIILIAFQRKGMNLVSGWAPSPWITGSVAFAASSLYMLTEDLPGWTKVAACLLIAAAFFTFIGRWSRQANWSGLHILGLAAGGIVTYAWLGTVMVPETGPKALIDHIGTAIFILGAAWLVYIAIKRRS